MESMLNLIVNRKTTGIYNPEISISKSEVEEIANYAFQSPSAFNLQNWYILAVHSTEAKEKLCEAAYGQPQTKDAAVTYVVCGDSEGYQHISDILESDVEEQIIPDTIKNAWVEMATNSHKNSATLRRDEAIRSASLLAMSLIYAAEAKGYDTGSVGGFDPEMVKRSFNLSNSLIPTILITVGKAADGNWQKKTRRPPEEVLTIA
ncbi:nitroreductase family protein [Vibrio hangzhouensis]|uniref:Nitroreductase n=1 Tax=Vibrio hangzhouensis TaxID=462991 RepID=A0A1H6CQ00_9VIBR|nr:nitroreductase family protein [Vibrio hangzhouensis]SEG75044.1 Nitroreductase [Vibrio hangzhouensis]